MATPLELIGQSRARENALEATLPYLVASGAWGLMLLVLAGPGPGRSSSALELAVLLSACVALTAWATARQMYLRGKRRPGMIVLMAIITSLGGLAGFSMLVSAQFKSACEKNLAGKVIDPTKAGPQVMDTLSVYLTGRSSAAPSAGVDARTQAVAVSWAVCQVGGVPKNASLPGVILRSPWDGNLPLLLWPVLGVVAALAALAFRDRRLLPTGIPRNQLELIRLAPAAGLGSVLVEPARDGQVQACENTTWWGATCGQLYSLEKKFSPGEWCHRCRLPFRPAARIELEVVSLVTDDVDLLNAMERLDADAWGQNQPVPASHSFSGEARWVRLGTIVLPEILSMAQVLAIVHTLLPKWAGDPDPRVAHAAGLAQARASRIAAWLWAGEMASRMHLANPSPLLALGLGPTRLDDLLPPAAGHVTLQLDVGLLPLEVRAGFAFRPPLSDIPPREEPSECQSESSAPRCGEPRECRPEAREIARLEASDRMHDLQVRNIRYTTWIPTTSKAPPVAGAGVWVPRVEGEALRRWLTDERAAPGVASRRTEQHPRLIQDDAGQAIERGMAVPVPYRPYVGHLEAPVGQEIRPPPPASLDFVSLPRKRAPWELSQEDAPGISSGPAPDEYDPSLLEPDPNAHREGASLTEWDWFEPEHLERLRRNLLVLVLDERSPASRGGVR